MAGVSLPADYPAASVRRSSLPSAVDGVHDASASALLPFGYTFDGDVDPLDDCDEEQGDLVGELLPADYLLGTHFALHDYSDDAALTVCF